VGEGVLDANLSYVRAFGLYAAFGDGDASVSGSHLDAMVGDAQANGKAEGGDEPFGCRSGIGVVKDGDDGAGGNRAVREHGVTLPRLDAENPDAIRPRGPEDSGKCGGSLPGTDIRAE